MQWIIHFNSSPWPTVIHSDLGFECFCHYINIRMLQTPVFPLNRIKSILPHVSDTSFLKVSPDDYMLPGHLGVSVQQRPHN